jgi:hypothetical protein
MWDEIEVVQKYFSDGFEAGSKVGLWQTVKHGPIFLPKEVQRQSRDPSWRDAQGEFHRRWHWTEHLS